MRHAICGSTSGTAALVATHTRLRVANVMSFHHHCAEFHVCVCCVVIRRAIALLLSPGTGLPPRPCSQNLKRKLLNKDTNLASGEPFATCTPDKIGSS